jgi:diacylglycerol kinase (ATP)
MRAVRVLHNPQAGRPAYGRAVDRAVAAVARQGVSVELVRATDLDRLRQAAQQAVADRVDAVLVAGGDGTLGAIAGELAHTPVALGALPAGTANVWARELGLPLPSMWQPGALERAALLLLDAPAHLTDLGRCNDRWFLSWAGVGLDAFVVQQFERQRPTARQVGGFLYNAALTFVVARGWRAVELRLEASGPAGAQAVEGRFLMATVCAIGLHGGGLFRFAGDVRFDDGLMDLWAFAGRGYADALAHTARVWRGTHRRHPGVLRLTGDCFDIYTQGSQAAHIDGEPLSVPGGWSRHLAVRVVPRCLRVLAPTALARKRYASPRS